ncbi:hypothetical protein [Mucilaginibacter aquariorum]|uniref:DUF4138 domain-containing protein n=1 Tax=Mucilaginibacter aquariorum TaxID=2967225 RepID=A0ABT1SZU3_9SPHI|nr:hypothetical protein [Mucilaginibacter aquariorum]MCQ6957733.1 hypothetical protein [Mucilaginibacter aquariorum]
MKKILTALLILIQLPVFAQNRLKDILELGPESFPANMPKVKIWISQNLSGLFISDFQFSESYNHDSKSFSFSILGKDVNGLPLSNTGGLVLSFQSVSKAPRYRSGTINGAYHKDINAYRTDFDVNNFHFTPKEYFMLTTQYLRISDDQAVANTLNFMVDNHQNTSKLKQFVKDVNLRMKTKLEVPKSDMMTDLMPALKTQFKDSIRQVIYYTYIEAKTLELTTLKMNEYFTIAIHENVFFKLDDMINPKIDISYVKPETLLFPPNMLSMSADSGANFKYSQTKAELDYKNRELTITFTGKFTRPVKLISGKYKDYTVKKGYKLTKPLPGKETLKNVNEVIVIVSEKDVRTEIHSLDEGEYELFNAKW